MIFVFKTNINKRSLKQTASVLKEKKEVVRWSVDLEDKDRVLRIETMSSDIDLTIHDFKNIGICCEELA